MKEPWVEPDAEKNEIYAKSELSRQDLTSLKDVGLMVSNPHRGIDSPDSF